MRNAADSGAGRFKALLSLLFLAAVVFCAFKIVPVYFENYELQGYLNNLAVQTTVQSPPATVRTVQDEVLEKAASLGLPVVRRNVNVSIGRTVRINLDYTVFVDLRFYTLPLHFTPSAENSNLT